MANPRAFISFDFDNNSTDRLLFVGQAKNSRTPFNIEDWSSKSSLPEKKWEALIEAKINKCNMVIVLVGKKMATASGVTKEIAFAKKNKIPVFGVYVGGATSRSTLPEGLVSSRVIEWSWGGIATAVDKVMKQGKNADK